MPEIFTGWMRTCYAIHNYSLKRCTLILIYPHMHITITLLDFFFCLRFSVFDFLRGAGALVLMLLWEVIVQLKESKTVLFFFLLFRFVKVIQWKMLRRLIPIEWNFMTMSKCGIFTGGDFLKCSSLEIR